VNEIAYVSTQQQVNINKCSLDQQTSTLPHDNHARLHGTNTACFYAEVLCRHVK